MKSPPLFSLVVILCGFSCFSARGKSEKELIEDFWNRKECIVERGISGFFSDSDEYLSACIYFHSITGIQIRGSGGTFGWDPNRYSQEDFEKVQEWYRKNKDKLCWNASREEVVLCQPVS